MQIINSSQSQITAGNSKLGTNFQGKWMIASVMREKEDRRTLCHYDKLISLILLQPLHVLQAEVLWSQSGKNPQAGKTCHETQQSKSLRQSGRWGPNRAMLTPSKLLEQPQGLSDPRHHSQQWKQIFPGETRGQGRECLMWLCPQSITPQCRLLRTACCSEEWKHHLP